MMSWRITWFCLLLLLISGAWCLAQEKDTMQHITPGRRNAAAQQAKPYVILISADGFRYNYADQYQAANLLRLSSRGVRAESMIPSFPSLTFPNHYTLVTGLYPAHHGLVNNNLYDRRRKEIYTRSKPAIAENPYYYGGKPLWVLAEQQQLLSACFYWVGSEVAIDGTQPTYYYNYNEMIPLSDRLQTVKKWLQLPDEQRPHFITFYMPEVDHAGHSYGPDHAETIKAIGVVDSAVGQLTAMVDSLGLPVNYVFVSDHGMALVDTVNTMLPPKADTTQWVTIAGDVLVNYYAREKADVMALYKQLKASAKGYDVYLRDQSPAAWHYRKKDDRYDRIGDVYLVARYPQIFSWTNKKINPGRHGFDPRVVKDLKASFMAWGPAFREGKVIGSFENIHVYSLVARLLGLQIKEPVDSKPPVLQRLLR